MQGFEKAYEDQWDASVSPPVADNLGGVGRADLLHWLALRLGNTAAIDALEHVSAATDLLSAHLPESLTLDATHDLWLGYEFQGFRPVARESERVNATPQSLFVPSSGSVVAPHLPLKIKSILAVVEREDLPVAQASEHPADNDGKPEIAPLDEATAGPRFAKRQFTYRHLIPLARLMPALKRRLHKPRDGAIDVDRLVAGLARSSLPRHLPKCRTQPWDPDLVVVFDFSRDTEPVHWDMHQLANALSRQCGPGQVSLRLMFDGPAGRWLDWHQAQRDDVTGPKSWAMPPSGSRVLLVSDFGLSCAEGAKRQWAWLAMIRRLQREGAQVLGLAPLAIEQLSASITALIPVLRWSPNARMQPAHALGALPADPEGLAPLLSMVAVCRRVDPPLLREIRRLLDRRQGEAGLELAVWNHVEMDRAGVGFVVAKPARLESLAQAFSGLPLQTQQALLDLLLLHHGHCRALLNHSETLQAIAYGSAGLVPSGQLAEVRSFVQRMVATLHQPAVPGSPDARAATAWAEPAAAWAASLSERAVQSCRDDFDALVEVLAKRQGDRGYVPPAWVESQQIHKIPDQQTVEYWLVEDREQNCFVLQPHTPSRWQVLQAGPLQLGLIQWKEVRQWRVVQKRWLRLGTQALNLPLPLVDGQPGDQLEIVGKRHRIVVAPLSRPQGVLDFERRNHPDRRPWQQFRVTVAGLDGHPIDFGGLDLMTQRSEGRADYFLRSAESRLSRRGSEVSVSYRVDAVFGALLDLTLKGVTQRFRYIEPGTFLMGSPDDEPGSSSDEGPQHPVTLTEGYWIADTPCTVDFWRAWTGQTGGFRARLKRNSGQHPVGEVSWDDIQAQLPKLRDIISSTAFEPALPTEAQWEYACRAGTNTAFWFGSEWSDDYGNISRENGDKGTTEVHQYPPNPWGLYDMHGNVWEWCDGYRRDYSREGQADPPDQQHPGGRALRGGSWYDPAQYARAACRNGYHRADRNDGIGFRLVLRSIEHQPGGGAASAGLRAVEPTVTAVGGPAVGSLSQVWDTLKGVVGLKGLGNPAPTRPRGSAAAPKNQPAAKKKK